MRITSSCLVMAIAFFVSGCGKSAGPELGNVAGTVTMDGAPLANVNVIFQPENGRPSTATTDESGNYKLRYSATEAGALPGTHRVMITAPALSDAEMSAPGAKPARSLPPKYNTNTELSAEVKPGANTLDFQLDSNG